MNPGQLQILQAAEAFDWLDSPGKQAAWESLYQRCAWRFATLSPRYYRLWFDHYADQWQPLLIVAEATGGELRLLMPLAIRNDSITGAGAHQAEYQGWLSAEPESHELLHDALCALNERLPGHTLRFHYLAPSIPAEVVERLCRRNPRVIASPCSRPLLRLDDDTVRQALRKKNTRSKLNRLKRRGELSCRRLSDPEEIERRLDAIIGMYDLRQGAANDSCPFVDDPHKRGFLIDWAKHAAAGELHVSCLMLDEEIIGAHIGVIGNEGCQLAILAYSPSYGAYSPGKLQVYETARLLAAEGIHWLDLTPGGDPWKERFASEHDQVFSVTVYPSRLAAKRVRLGSRIESFARRLLDLIGISPRKIKAALRLARNSSPHSRAVEPDEEANRKVEYHLVEFPALGGANVGEVHLDTLSDLTRYRPDGNGPGRQAFLRQALDRLESGHSAFTLMSGELLACCAWVTFDPARTAIIRDMYCSPDFPDAAARLMRGMLGRFKDSGVEAVLLRIPGSRVANAEWLAELGFRAADQPRGERPAGIPNEKP